MIDNEFTKKITDWLNGDHSTSEQVMAGAMLLLQINKNRCLYQTICRKPLRYVDKLTYELRKHLNYRLDGLTHKEMSKMVTETMPKVERLIAEDSPEGEEPEEDNAVKARHGKRPDHDLLPDDIQALWDNNAERYRKIKEAFATCQTLTTNCDRYEYVKFIKEAYESYKQDMAKYDAYGLDNGEDDATATAKDINTARSYVSRYRKVYDKYLIEQRNEEAAQLAENIQQRVDILTAANAEISDKLRTWLISHKFNL